MRMSLEDSRPSALTWPCEKYVLLWCGCVVWNNMLRLWDSLVLTWHCQMQCIRCDKPCWSSCVIRSDTHGTIIQDMILDMSTALYDLLSHSRDPPMHLHCSISLVALVLVLFGTIYSLRALMTLGMSLITHMTHLHFLSVHFIHHIVSSIQVLTSNISTVITWLGQRLPQVLVQEFNLGWMTERPPLYCPMSRNGRKRVGRNDKKYSKQLPGKPRSWLQRWTKSCWSNENM